MKTTTNALLIMVLFLFGTAMGAWAQNGDGEPITVTFRINTSTVPDTLDENGVVQIRGEFDGQSEENVTWDENSVTATNVGGDYWELPLEMYPGDVLTHKFWVGFDLENGAGYNGGWEVANPADDNDNYVFTVPDDASEDMVTDVMYVARPDTGRVAPYEDVENYQALHFRVNMGAAVATGTLDPENEDHKVGIRGDINDEEGTFEYKFVIDKGGDQVTWESIDNRQGVVPEGDSTFAWSFFDDRRPPEGDIATANLEFAANVSLLENLEFFNRAVGDSVKIRGSFNDWSEGEMIYEDAADVWTANYEVTEEVGQELAYKFFIDWDDSRFDDSSPNYIEHLHPDNGWEEPGATGGSDRLYEFTGEEVQPVPGDFGTNTAFFNSLPEQAVIESANVDEGNPDDFQVTFRVDMTDALDHSTPFDPATDELFLFLQTPVFAITQDLPTGADVLDEQANRDRVRFEATGEGNWYELTLPLELPTENHIGFTLAYETEDGSLIENGGGFDAGRRYYRYIEPLAIEGEDVFWRADNILNDIVWKPGEDLDFEDPPSYGIGEEEANGKLVADMHEDLPTSIDWGETQLVLSLEPKLNEDSRNYFYSGTLYLETEPTSSENSRGQIPVAYQLEQNYPNPFNPTTNIRFTIPENQDVRLDVFNILGQRVANLVDTQMSAGTHTVQFDASRLASGTYIYRLQAGDYVQQNQMMLIK